MAPAPFERILAVIFTNLKLNMKSQSRVTDSEFKRVSFRRQKQEI